MARRHSDGLVGKPRVVLLVALTQRFHTAALLKPYLLLGSHLHVGDRSSMTYKYGSLSSNTSDGMWCLQINLSL